MVLYFDEAGSYKVRPYDGYSYAPHRRPKRKRADYKALGRSPPLLASYHRESGRVIRHYGENKCWPQVAWALKKGILAFEGMSAVWVIWDNAKAHGAKGLMIWLRGWNQKAKERGLPRIIPVYLPVQAPWLNAIEGIFRGMYGAVIAGSDYGCGEEMQLAMERYFERRERELVEVEEMVGEEVETIILN